MSGQRVLFLVTCPTRFRELIHLLVSVGLDIVTNRLGCNVRNAILAGRPDIVVIEHCDTSSQVGLDVASECKKFNSEIRVVIATAKGSEDLAIQTLRAGLDDYVRLPCPPDSFLARIRKLLPQTSGRSGLSPKTLHRECSSRLVTASNSMEEIQKYLRQAAKANCTVLITGETGTGKELFAEFVHENSSRKDKPFVCINCAAIPETLLESELFGHTKGAFTGAQELTEGQLSAADGGTVFLDEIGDLSPVAQAKILRVLETKQICRLGGTKQMSLDLRFVAATNQDLYGMAAQRAFRHDLLFRLDVAHVHLPPLRERKEEIPLLVEEFCRQFSRQMSAPSLEISDEFLGALVKYDWPGNIRELKNVLESLLLLELPTPVGVEHLPARIRQYLETTNSVTEGERELLIAALFSTKWNKTKAAEMLNWSRMTIYRKMNKYKIPEHCQPKHI
jgi:DNA-binding NtrC family response regulator